MDYTKQQIDQYTMPGLVLWIKQEIASMIGKNRLCWKYAVQQLVQIMDKDVNF